MSLLLLGAGAAGAAAPPAAPAFGAVSTGTIASGATTVTLPTRASGDTLLFVLASAAAAPAANTGWTQRQTQQANDLISTLTLYTRESDGTDNTPLGASILGESGYTCVAVQNTVTGHDASDKGSGAESTNIVAPTVDPTGTPGFLFSAYLRAAGTGDITLPGGQTGTTAVLIGDPIDTLTLRCGYELLSTGDATGTRTATQASAHWCAINVATT